MAAKNKIVYICSNCGFESAKWAGKCPDCGEWNTMEEMDYILKCVPEVVEYLRGMSPVWRDLQTGKRTYIL